jgi:hypothetical protein
MHGILQVLSGICSETEVSEQLYLLMVLYSLFAVGFNTPPQTCLRACGG